MDEPPQAPAFDLDRALSALAGRKSVLIYTHDNPDPDSLAAAMSLERLMELELGAEVTLTHGGIVGRAQNRAMVDALKLPLVPAERIEPDEYDAIALVDSQPETGNNSLPPGHRIDVVIDHHPPRAGSARAPWCDIRPDLGATSTIVFEYLRARHVPVDASLATAVFFALRTETRDLGRESTEAERRAYLELVPLVDHSMLYRMTHPKVPREHFAALDRALRSAQVFGDVVAVNLGDLGYPDLVAEIADLLLSYEGARYVLCIGQYEGSAYLSLRTEATDARAGSVMRQIVGTDGAAGGHGTMAGARLFAPVHVEQELQKAFLLMVERLRGVLGHEAVPGTPLLRPQGPRQMKTMSGRPRGR
jgi:nanoRNase/pAp phosphatase (c-di-AMP/oligoRNAs hydrolase)